MKSVFRFFFKPFLYWLNQYRIVFFKSTNLIFFKKKSVFWKFFTKIRKFDKNLKYAVWNYKAFFNIFNDNFFVFMKWNVHNHAFYKSFVISCNCECEINSIFSSFWIFFKSDTSLLFVKSTHMTSKTFEMRAETILFCNVLLFLKLFFDFLSNLLLIYAGFLSFANILFLSCQLFFWSDRKSFVLSMNNNAYLFV